MSEPFLGEIRCVGFNFAPKGWAHCNGQVLLISQHQALFSLLGTTYGGNGQITFNLPNFDGRIPRGLQHYNPDSTPPTKFGGILFHAIPSTLVPATSIRIVLDNP